jgi:hypothetical protein
MLLRIIEELKIGGSKPRPRTAPRLSLARSSGWHPRLAARAQTMAVEPFSGPEHTHCGLRAHLFLVGRYGELLAASRTSSQCALSWMRTSQGGMFRLPRPSFPRWSWPLTIVAMLLCDEVYAMRRAIFGQWKRDNNGSIRFRPVTEPSASACMRLSIHGHYRKLMMQKGKASSSL